MYNYIIDNDYTFTLEQTQPIFNICYFKLSSANALPNYILY